MNINLSNAIVEKVQTMADKSIQIRLGLRELPPSEMTKVFQALSNGEENTIEADITEGKTPSQRLRAVLCVAWKENVSGVQTTYKDFDYYYRLQMEKWIDEVKASLPQL